jgi:tetratricopeptide (TPR) repeat protein
MDKIRLGQALIDLGLLDQERLGQALAAHARMVLLKVFSWSDGEYSFEEEGPDTPSEEDAAVTLSTGEIILEAVRSVSDPDVVRYALGDIDRILSLSTDPLLRFQKITLSPADGFLLSRVDGTLSAREVVQLTPDPVGDVQRSLFGLLCTGIIEYLPLPPKPRPKPARAAAALPTPASAGASAADGRAATAPGSARPAANPAGAEPPPSRTEAQARREEVLRAYEGLKNRNHFDVLGIPRGSSEAQIKEAYFRLARRFHPDVHHDPAFSDLRDKLEAVFIRLGEAYEVLRNPRTRASHEADLAARTPRTAPEPAAPEPPAGDPVLEMRIATESIRKAEKHFLEEKYWDAIQLLEKAIPAVDGKLKQRARVLLARAYVKNPKWVKRAEDVLQTVVREDARNADAYFQLGDLYRNGGLRSRALAMFRKVVELKPDHEEALVQVATLTPQEPEPPQEGGGILKRIFGRS